jgi:hypothetical protein
MIRPRRRRRWPWFFGLTGLVLIVLVQVGATVLRSAWMERQLARVIESGIQFATGEQAIIGGLEISPALGRFDIEGLVLTHISEDPARSGTTIVAVERIRVFLGTMGGAYLRRIEVERPVVRLHIDEDGLREFRNAAESDTPTTAFPWSELLLNDGTVVVDLPNGSLAVTGIQVGSSEIEERVNLDIAELRFTTGGIDEIARELHFPDVQLTPERLWLPLIDVKTDGLAVKGSLAAIADGPIGGDLSVSMNLPLLDALVAPPIHFEGVVHVDTVLSGTVAAPVFSGVLLVDDVIIHDEDHFGEPMYYEIERVLMDWNSDGQTLTVERGRIDWAMGEVLVNGTYDYASTAVVGEVFPHNLDLAEAIRQAGGHPHAWTTFTGDGEIHVAGTFSPMEVSGTMDLAVADFVVGNGPIRAPSTERLINIPRLQVQGEIGITGDGIRLHSQRTIAGATVGDVNAYIGFDWFGPLDIEVDLDRTNLTTFRPLKDLELVGRGRLTGTIAGPFSDVKIAGRGHFYDFEILGIPFADEFRATLACDDRETLRFDKVSARKGQTRYHGAIEAVIGDDIELDIDVHIAEGRIADLLNIVGAADGTVDGGVTGNASLRGDPYELSGEVDLQFDRIDVLGERFSTGEMLGWMDQGRFTLDALSVSRWSGDEGVVVRGTVGEAWATNLDFAATGLRLDRLDAFAATKLPIRGVLYMDGRIGGTLFTPEPHGRIAIRDTWYAGKPVPDSTVFVETVGDRMRLEGHLLGQGLGFTGAIDLTGPYRYALDVDLTRFPLHTAIPVAADGGPVEAWLSGTVEARGALGEPDAGAEIVARGDALSIGWNRHKIHAKGPWSYEQTGTTFSLKQLGLSGDQTDLQLGVHKDAEGRVFWSGSGTIDLDLARMFIPDLTRAEGTAAVRVRTRPSGAGLELDVAMCKATVAGEWFPQELNDIATVVHANADGYGFRALDPMGEDEAWVSQTPLLRTCAARLGEPALVGTVGGGKFVAAGDVAASGWTPTRFNMVGRLDQGTVQYFDFLPAAVGDAEVTLEGTMDDLLLSGRIRIHEMLFTERIVWEEWLLEVDDERLGGVEEEEDALFDLDLFIDAPSTIRMRNNVADIVAAAELRVVGDTAEPGLVGDIRAEPGGRVHLKEREFELLRAEIRFVEPTAYDPDLDIVLSTDVRSRDEIFDVEYRVVGTYEDWRAETSSDPPLESADINALLLFGMTRDELERYGGLGGALAVEGGDLLASRMLFASRTGNERGGFFKIVDPLRPDRLDLVSGVSERGSGMVSSDLRLLYENELDDVSLPGMLMIFEQNITRASDTYLGLEQRLARTLYARSYWASEQRGRHLPIGGAYGLEVKVRWELD